MHLEAGDLPDRTHQAPRDSIDGMRLRAREDPPTFRIGIKRSLDARPGRPRAVSDSPALAVHQSVHQTALPDCLDARL